MFKLGDKWRKHDFEALGEGKDRLKKIMSETARCIKCYQCIEAARSATVLTARPRTRRMSRPANSRSTSCST